MTEALKATCETCRFWKRGPDIQVLQEGTSAVRTLAPNPWGICRRHSPFVTGGLHCPVETAWPNTQPEDWCGEHQPTPPTERPSK